MVSSPDIGNCVAKNSDLFKYVSGVLLEESILEVQSERSPRPFYKHEKSFKYKKFLNFKITNQ